MDARALIDDALEISVVGSFTRIGPAVRRRLFGWTDAPVGALAGRTALVTGPTSGLGRAATQRLAELGARVILVGRDRTKLNRLASELGSLHGEDRFPIIVADMSSLGSVRAAAKTVLETEPRLDVLIDNAGAIYPEWGLTPDGIERTLAVLVVGPWLLTSLLVPLLRAAPAGRVIAVTSGGMYTQSVRIDDLQWRDRPFSGPRVYAQAKRIQVALVREWARRLDGSSVSVNAMHPGWADTPGLAESLPRFRGLMRPLLRTPEEGADTIVWLATTGAIDPPGGRLYLDRRPRPFDRIPQTRLSAPQRRALWDAVAQLAAV
jgi:NAD(P)-dependent dehydrogenase (short-subunit alcohol dehydrogenase family)